MKKSINIFLIGIVAIILGLSMAIYLMQSALKNEKDKYESNIGHKIIIAKDTLTITNYSRIMETFTLSNGTTVDASFVFKNEKSIK